MLYRKLCFLCVALWISCQPLFGQQGDALKLSDVHKIMQEILKQHYGQKEVTAAIIKHSFLAYIDQFDPDRIYLLQEEVEPYTNMTEWQINAVMEQYKNNNLAAYTQLNQKIEQAIERSRGYRKELEAYIVPLLQASAGPLPNEEWPPVTFAKSALELKDRVRTSMVRFFHNARKRYGDTIAKNNGKNLVELYENTLRHDEEQYVATDETGKQISSSELQGLFALHVLKALASGLDAHTKVYNPNEAFDLKMRLEKEYEGIGIQLAQKGDAVVVAGLIKDGPAAKSGLVKVNDRLIAVNGTSVASEVVDNVATILHDVTSPEVKLTLERGESDNPATKQVVQVTLKRAIIPINEGRVESDSVKLDHGIIGMITLHSFYQGTDDISSAQDLRKAIEKLDKEGNLRGLILDLRDNTGGFLNQAVKVVSLFISSGVVVISKYSNGEEHFFRDVDNKPAYTGPMIVLTSRETASAAEIVAQALQDYGVALIVGDEQTYGKGTIQSQTITEHGSPSYFKVTVGKYYTVSGKTPQLQGVKADIIVPSQLDYEAVGEEFLKGSMTDKPDTIAPEYDDSLKDVSPSQRPWYLHYYTPHLQHKEEVLRQMLPALKRNSTERIANNKEYQSWIQRMKGLPGAKIQGKDYLFPELPAKKDSAKDLQVQEAILIMKDMIRMEGKGQ